ncbi:MAG: hypothetical protein MUC49_02395 [Raineya sp.]|jgi:hypothetical protein|nr:hypothetical protein [Raineya sp.]
MKLKALFWLLMLWIGIDACTKPKPNITKVNQDSTKNVVKNTSFRELKPFVNPVNEEKTIQSGQKYPEIASIEKKLNDLKSNQKIDHQTIQAIKYELNLFGSKMDTLIRESREAKIRHLEVLLLLRKIATK